MIIHVFVDVYPHPFKPYFDVQLEEWEKMGHKVKVFSLSRIPGSFSPMSVKTLKTLRNAPIELCIKIVLAFMRSPVRTFSILSKDGNILEKIKLLAVDSQLPREAPDLIFVHNLAACVRFAYLKEILPNVPFSMYYHGGEIPGVPAIPPQQAKHALMAPDIVFSNTKYSIGDAICRGAPASKVRCVPVGFRLEDYPLDIPRKYMKDGYMNIISAGRIALEKGIDIAILALEKLHKQKIVKFKYVIVGDGPEMQNIISLVHERGLTEHVEFAGILPHNEVVERFRNADVLLLPSIVMNNCAESQACVMQEAMLVGVVVVASNIGGVSESIPEEMQHLLFMEGDQHQLAHNLYQLYLSGVANMMKLGAIGREFVMQNYDVKLLNNKLLQESIHK
ncbi:MAG TPA: glycosyltransferase family 4 protein [Deltaproteobacteria bacterium]|nr:glycosyltransferase family 4 protein [Deltaproteobacteria bacterium]